MSMMPPNQGPGAGPPPGPPAPPGPQAAPGGPPQGGPMAPPPGAMPPAPTLPPTAYTDLSLTLPPHWQIVDGAARSIQAALNTGGFFREPAERAAIKKIYEMLTRLVSSKVQKSTPDSMDKNGAPGDSESLPNTVPGAEYSVDNSPDDGDTTPDNG